jgi:AraC-like DNA-binding protein
MMDSRRVLNLSDLGIPDVPVFGRYEYTSVHPGLGTHSHLGAVEICYLHRGRQTYRVAGHEYELAGGDVFVTAPGEPHDTAGHPEEPGVLYWLNLRMPNRGASLLMLPPSDSAIVARRLSNLPKPKFGGTAALRRIFEEVFMIYDRPKHPLKKVTVCNLLVRCVLEVLTCAGREEGWHCSPVVMRILERIQSHPEESYSLNELAREVGLSVSRFKARFRAETGIGPHEYILRSKIDAAKRCLLNRRVKVTEIAMQLGFNSSQYFATAFKRYTSQTPRDFRIHGPTIPLRNGAILMPREWEKPSCPSRRVRRHIEAPGEETDVT